MKRTTQKMLAALSLVLTTLVVAATASAADSRFLVVMDSAQNFQRAASASFTKSSITGNYVARSNSFLGTNARPQAVLSRLKMFVVSGSDAQMRDLSTRPGVALVEKEHIFKAPRPMPLYGSFSFTANVGKGKKLTPAMPWGIKAVRAPQAWAAAGTRGQGVRVLVLDTGLDKDHPSMKTRLEEGRDFVGDNIAPYAFFDQVGHGTHVAATILAESLSEGFVGVAPDAALLAGRVCSADGCSTLAIVAGINWGIEKKVGVINMSLGGAFPSSAQKRAVEAADQANIVVVAASGNDGKASVGYPAGFPTVIAVGAVDVNSKKADFSQWGPELAVVAPGVDVMSAVPMGSGRATTTSVEVNGKSSQVESTGMSGSPLTPGPVTNTLVLSGLGKDGEFPETVKGQFALISRGEITFADKVKNAIAAGAAGVVIYNNQAGLLSGSLTDDGSEVAVPVVMITQQVGLNLKSAIEAGSRTAATIQSFKTDYASFQGTSMASPHAAGVVALIRAANPNLTTTQVRKVLLGTTTALPEANDQNQWGKGLVNAEQAVKTARSK